MTRSRGAVGVYERPNCSDSALGVMLADESNDWLIRAVGWPDGLGDSFEFRITLSRAREACQGEKIVPDKGCGYRGQASDASLWMLKLLKVSSIGQGHRDFQGVLVLLETMTDHE